MFHGVFVANLCGCSPRSLKSGDWLRRGFIPTLGIDSLRIVALPQVLGLTHASLLEYFEEEMIAFERQGLNGQTVQVGTGRNLSGLPTYQDLASRVRFEINIPNRAITSAVNLDRSFCLRPEFFSARRW